jgi:hypothetical protein
LPPINQFIKQITVNAPSKKIHTNAYLNLIIIETRTNMHITNKVYLVYFTIKNKDNDTVIYNQVYVYENIESVNSIEPNLDMKCLYMYITNFNNIIN